MDVRLMTPSCSTNDVDVSEFLSLTNPSPTPPLMHSLQPLLPNGADVEADLGVMSSDLEAMGGVDPSKPGSYDLLNSSEASSGQGVRFVSIQSGLDNSAGINVSLPSTDLTSDCSQYYIQCNSDTMMTLGSGSSYGQLTPSAVVTLPSQVPTSSPHPASDLLTMPNSYVLPSTQSFGNFRPAGVIDVSTPPKKPLSPYMRFSKGVRYFNLLTFTSVSAIIISFFFFKEDAP